MFFTKLPLLLMSSMLSFGAGQKPTAPTTEAAAPARAERKDSDGLCARIECSDSQEASLAKIAKTTKEKLRAAHGKSDDHRTSLAAAMRDSSLTRAEAEAALARDASAEAREDIMVDAFVQVHAVLDATQRATLATMIETEGMRAVIGGKHHGKHDAKIKAKGKQNGRGPGSLKAKRNGKPSIDDKANAKPRGGAPRKAERTSVRSLRDA